MRWRSIGWHLGFEDGIASFLGFRRLFRNFEGNVMFIDHRVQSDRYVVPLFLQFGNVMDFVYEKGEVDIVYMEQRLLVRTTLAIHMSVTMCLPVPGQVWRHCCLLTMSALAFRRARSTEAHA
mmetsp:Transcript_22264/g.30099  ORF Transcript_22264/g.30099 Transcript_22264/m.30099 type:complete len:122 (-) Transcript_22264:848-1213(-)